MKQYLGPALVALVTIAIVGNVSFLANIFVPNTPRLGGTPAA